jgi:hypothetical protein
VFALGARTFIHSGRRGRSATARELCISVCSLRAGYGVMTMPHGGGMLMRRSIARLPSRPMADTVNESHSASTEARRTVNRPIRLAVTLLVTCRPFSAVRSVTRSTGANPRPATTNGCVSTSTSLALGLAEPADESVAATSSSSPIDIENLTERLIAAKNTAARKAISPVCEAPGPVEQALG